MTEVILKLDKGDSVSVEKTRSQTINYSRVGNGKMNRTSQMKSIDLMKEIVDMAKPEIKALVLLMGNVPWEQNANTGKYFTIGLIYLPSSTFTSKAEQLSFQKGIKMLRDKDIVRKDGASNYMLNPKVVIPTDINMALQKWGTLQPRNK